MFSVYALIGAGVAVVSFLAALAQFFRNPHRNEPTQLVPSDTELFTDSPRSRGPRPSAAADI